MNKIFNALTIILLLVSIPLFADPDSDLFNAAQNGDLPAVREALKAGADVNAKGDDGATPLLYAAQNNNIDIVKILLEKGALPNAIKLGGITALEYAVDNKNYTMMKLLLDHKANPKIGDNPLVNATQSGNFEMVKLLLLHGAEINKPWDTGHTPLMGAEEGGNIDVIKLLIEKQVNINSISRGKNALMMAIIDGKDEIAEYLIQKGADVNIPPPITEGTPLLYACDRPHPINSKLIKLLLNKNADTNAKYPEMMYTHEETALHLLIKNDTKLSNNELYDLAVLFLKKKFNINSTDDLQQTVLFLAVDRNDFKLVQLFLDNGADPNIKSGRRTPLKLAIKGKKDEKIIALLRQKGAKE